MPRRPGRARVSPGDVRHDAEPSPSSRSAYGTRRRDVPDPGRVLIIHRYLLREVVLAVAAVLAVLVFVYSSNRFVRFLTEAAIGRTSTELLFQMLALKIVGNLAILTPVALLLGCIFALGRMHRDSEVVAMTASGLSTRTVLLAVLLFSIVFGAFTGVLSLYVSPMVYKQYDVVRERAREGYHVSGILPGRFKSFDGGDQYVFQVIACV